MEFLASLENSGFITWLRESPSVFAYPTLIAFHTFGMAFLVGTTAAIALRSLGIARGLAIAPLNGFFPIVWTGFWMSAVSGGLLLVIDIRTFLTMPQFYIKMFAIAGALVCLRMLRAELFGRPLKPQANSVSSRARSLAIAILLLWTVGMTAGRVTAYETWIGWETAGAVLVVAIVLLAGWLVTTRLLGPGQSVREWESGSSPSARKPV